MALNTPARWAQFPDLAWGVFLPVIHDLARFFRGGVLHLRPELCALGYKKTTEKIRQEKTKQKKEACGGKSREEKTAHPNTPERKKQKRAHSSADVSR